MMSTSFMNSLVPKGRLLESHCLAVKLPYLELILMVFLVSWRAIVADPSCQLCNGVKRHYPVPSGSSYGGSFAIGTL